MKKILAIVCIATVFPSCEKVIEPGELPEQDTRLVINTVLDKDSAITVNLSQSKSIISGKDYKTVDKENVFVYEDDVLFEQLSFVNKGKYVGTKKPTVGKTYKVIARAKALQDAEGTSKLPPTPLIASVERIDTNNSRPYVTDYGNGQFYISGTVSYKIAVDDNVGVNDFYSIAMLMSAVDSTGAQTFDLGSLYLTDLLQGQNTGTETFYYGGLVGNDQTSVVNGKRIFSFSANLYRGGTGKFTSPITFLPVLVVTQYSEEYYKYMATVSKQLSTGASFFAEPTVIYSNCNNGMGIVGGRNSTVKFLDPVIIK